MPHDHEQDRTSPTDLDLSSLCGFETGCDVYIQKTGIVQNCRIFDARDDVYANYRQSFCFVEGLLYRNIIRHWMNVRVRRIRSKNVPRITDLALPNHEHEGPRHAS